MGEKRLRALASGIWVAAGQEIRLALPAPTFLQTSLCCPDLDLVRNRTDRTVPIPQCASFLMVIDLHSRGRRVEDKGLEYLLRRNRELIMRACAVIEQSQSIRAARNWNYGRPNGWARCFDQSGWLGRTTSDSDRHTMALPEHNQGQRMASSRSGRC